MQAGDPRADPAVVDLIELAGLWLAAGERTALCQTLGQLIDLVERRYADEGLFADRFRAVLSVAEQSNSSEDDLRRTYRRATLG